LDAPTLEKWKRSPATALAAATEKAKGRNASIAAEVVELYKKLVRDSNMDSDGKKWALSLS
jgi:hypothetical protein